MFDPDLCSAIAHARYRTLLREAEMERLVSASRRGRPKASLARRLILILGRSLIGGR